MRGAHYFQWAEHVRTEPSEPGVASLDARDAVLLRLLLRDRYFPRCWRSPLGDGPCGETENEDD